MAEQGTPQVIKFDLKTLELPNGAYRFQVRTKACDCGDSVFSDVASYVVSETSIEAPTIRINGDVLTIEPVTGAVRYDVYADNAKIAQTSAESLWLYEIFEAKAYKSGRYTIMAKAIADDGTESRISNTVNYNYVAPEALATPTVTIEGNILTIIDESGLAEEFDILVDGVVVKTIEEGIISFAVTDTYNGYAIECRAEEGMTWQEWCDSDYNDDSLFVYEGEGGAVYVVIDGSYYGIEYMSDAVMCSEVIMENANYTYTTGDSGSEYRLRRGE